MVRCSFDALCFGQKESEAACYRDLYRLGMCEVCD